MDAFLFYLVGVIRPITLAAAISGILLVAGASIGTIIATDRSCPLNPPPKWVRIAAFALGLGLLVFAVLLPSREFVCYLIQGEKPGICNTLIWW